MRKTAKAILLEFLSDLEYVTAKTFTYCEEYGQKKYSQFHSSSTYYRLFRLLKQEGIIEVTKKVQTKSAYGHYFIGWHIRLKAQ